MRLFKRNEPRELSMDVEFILENGKSSIKITDKLSGDVAEREMGLEGLLNVLKWSAHSLQALGYKTVDEAIRECSHEP